MHIFGTTLGSAHHRTDHRNSGRRMLPMALAAVLCAAPAAATEVTLVLRDQGGTPIPASEFVTAGGVVPNGGTVTLAAGSQAIDVFPGINGLQTQTLSRAETIAVAGVAQTFEFTWKLASLRVTIVDQDDVPIPESETNLHHDNASVAVIANGDTIDLPVTSDPTEAPISGVDGYLPRLFPGTGGIRTQVVHREEAVESLSAAGLEATYTWRLAPLTVTVVDQLGDPIAGSSIAITALGGTIGVIANGGSLALPVTDDPDFPPVLGAAQYDAKVFPGTDGQQTLVLFREEPTAPLTPAGLDADVEWLVIRGPLTVVDAGEVPVAGATIGDSLIFSPPIASGTEVELPINDAGVYPGIGGFYAGGYPLTLDLGAAGQATESFSVLAGATILPLFVDVGGADYGLRLPADTDGDGVPDSADNCPFDFNPDQSDIDFDGLGDACDDEFTEETVVDAVEVAIDVSIELIELADVPGANGLINKLTGNGGVLPNLEDAVADYLATGDAAAYEADLLDVLSKCESYRNQLIAKINNGSIPPEYADDLLAQADLICGSIQTLIDNIP